MTSVRLDPSTSDLVQRLERTRDDTLAFFALGDDDLARTYAAGKWSVRFILLHLADGETVLFDRIRRILSEPRQVLWVFDQDAWAKGLDYSRVPLELAARVYESVRNAVIYYASQYYAEKGAPRVRAQRHRGANAQGRVRQGRVPQSAPPRSNSKGAARHLK